MGFLFQAANLIKKDELSSGEVEHLAYFLVELAGACEFLQCQMHAVAPVVVGIGWYVYAF